MCREFCEIAVVIRLLRGCKRRKRLRKRRFGVGECWFFDMVLRFSSVVRAVANVKTVVAVGDAVVMWLVFFMFHVLFAGFHRRMWCLLWAMRRKCGAECRNGCGFCGLQCGFWRLRMGNGGFGVVFRGVLGLFFWNWWLGTGMFVSGTWVCRVGLFRFRLKKKRGTSHDVPMLKKIYVDFRLDLPFCILSFGVFVVQR